MERDEVDKTSAVGTSDDVDSRSAVNATVLDYYKKFGRKRDLEQFFSLSTAQSDIKDTSGLFWRKMKSENDSSDSGGRKSDSSHEVCRISIMCSLPDPSSSQDDDDQKTKTDSPHTESPPIITEEVPADVSMRQTDDESINFDDNNSQKSLDALLDLSAHKPLSPTSSITSQRKLEWDSLADVGYANESDRKNSASSLSTLERLALKQQYSNNDSKQGIGPPTSHSTPLDENDNKYKPKKGLGKKTTKIYKKDVDFVEVNVPHNSETNQAPSINVNLTKHISFNVERDGGVTIDNVKNDVSISPEKVTVETTPCLGMDKEIQTSLPKAKSPKEKSNSMDETPKPVNPYNQKIPVMISLNTLRKRLRRKKSRNIRRKLRPKKQVEASKDLTPQEKSGEQLSEAESFEYMPGHMYHQNQMKDNEPRPDNSTAGNKSSLESSGPLTTDSSKGSNHSLTKDLEKCVDLLKVTLQKRYDDGNTKKKLIKDIVHRLINSKYRDDETTTEFLSGLTFDTKKLGNKENNTTTSTSDANNTEDSANKKPKKSILRNEKFNPNVVASTSQSAPNLFSASSEKLNTNLMKALASNTDSDVSSRGKTSSENAFPKTSSEELYLKYLEALRREEAYKRHLKDKEMFLKQKLVSSETAFKVPIRQEAKVSSRLKDLMNDLTRNNYDDGSGDASKLEGGSSSNMHLERFNAMRNQRSHSVFTLSSSHSGCQKRPNLKKKMQAEREIGEAGPSKHHYCCCPHHYLNSKADCVDSSVQVSIKQCEEAAINDMPCQTKPPDCQLKTCECKKCKPLSPRNTRVIPDKKGEIKYVCLCNGKQVSSSDVGDNFMIFKCSKLTNRGVQLEDPVRIGNTGIQCESICNSVKDDKIDRIQSPCQMNTGTESSNSDNTSKHARRYSKSSQTNMVVNMCLGGSEAKNLCGTTTKCILEPRNTEKCYTVCEATRCLQTEISINPQISDPSLSDINIIDDCVKLICENRRKIEIQSSDSEGGKSFSNVCTNSTSEKLLTQSAGAYNSKFKRSEQEKQASKEPPSLLGKDYTVPIKGTNMTITVNLTGTDINKKVDQVNEGVVTEEICTVDEATSAIEKNKSTQCLGTVFVDKRKFCMIEPSVSRKSCLAKKHLIESSTHCNTFPKIDAAKVKPPFKRSNTDTGKLSICSCIQTDFIKTKDVECNNNQTVIICDEPCTQVVTCENSCQVDKGCECKDTKTDSIKSNKSETCNKTIKINIGIQKDFCDENAKIVAQKPKTEICCCTNDVGVATETEAKTDKGFCVGCQTDVITKDKNQEADCKPSCSDKEPMEIPVKPDTCCFKVCFPGKSNKGPIKPDCKPSCSDNEPKETPVQPNTCCCKVCFPGKSNKVPVKPDCKPSCSDNEPKETPIQPDTCCFQVCLPGKSSIGPVKPDCKPSCSNNEPKETPVQPDTCYCKVCFPGKLSKGPVKLDCKPSCSDNEPKVTLVQPDTCCCKVCLPGKLSKSPVKPNCKPSCSDNEPKKTPVQPETCCYKVCFPGKSSKGPVIDMIQDITRRYSKTEMVKIKNNKCFSEIITVLNYLLETDESTEPEPKTCYSTCTDTKSSCNQNKSNKISDVECCSDKLIDKSIQLSCQKSFKDNKVCAESSDLPCSSDMPTTSSDSAACKVLNKIKKECEKYHQKVKCRGRKCEVSSSTSVNCEKCKKVHHCACRSHKCKRSKAFEKLQKKCIAYNLIIQTSESMLSEDTVCEKKNRPLKNIFLKVPKRKCDGKKESTCREQVSRRSTPRCSPKCNKDRSRSCPDECETSDENARRFEVATLREYLEQNRPDFVENTSQRRNCLKFISERRANERVTQRDLLSLHVEQQPDLTNLSSDELRLLAKQIGLDLRSKRPDPKFMSEREMKQHSENIYKTLPEVVQKKEDKKKENMKKTNLLMANLFKKNLQKLALRGSVNRSNYSMVVKM